MQVPGNINSHLRSFQRTGVQFLFRQYAQGQGGILGDDMVRDRAQAWQTGLDGGCAACWAVA